MKWLRLYHDTTTDPKWRLVSADSGQPVGTILSVWLEMLICASKAADRGTLEGWDDRVVAAHLGYRTDAVVSIRQAMQGVVLDGMRLTGWDKRQRTSDDVAGRVQRHRNKAKEPDPGGGSGNGADNSRNVTSHKGNGSVTLQSGDVTLHSENVTVFPLRAKTTDTEVSVASATAPPAAPEPSLKSELFGRCLAWLVADSGRSEKSLRPMVGRWIAAHGEGAVLAAIVEAQRQSAVAPVGFIEGVLKSGSKRHGKADGDKHERLRRALGGAFSDFVDGGSGRSGGQRCELAIGNC